MSSTSGLCERGAKGRQSCGMEKIAPLTRYGRPLQEQRRMMQRVLNQRVVRSYEYIQRREINNLINNIQQSPEAFITHIKR